MTKRDSLILQKIVTESEVVGKLLDGVDEAMFLSDEQKMRAVCMTFINIGELVKNLTAELRLSYPEIPWKNISGLRDIAAHGYFTLDMRAIRKTALEALPTFEKEVQSILLKQ
jgi:uncharacterized protein with HEPN domain